MGKSKIIKKYYSKIDNKFHVVREFFDSETYDTIEEFAKAINNNFTDINLLDFDFLNCDVKSIKNLKKAILPSLIEKELGIYSDECEKKLSKLKKLALKGEENQLSVIDTKIDIRKPFELSVDYEEFSDYCCYIFYISDIHLVHKIQNKFGDGPVNQYEIDNYVKEIVHKLKESEQKILRRIDTRKCSIVNIYLGDISFDFNLYKTFFDEVAETQRCEDINIAILGNHELWFKKQKSFDDIVDKYRDYLESKNIYLLQNDALLLIKNDDGFDYWDICEECFLEDIDGDLFNKLYKNPFLAIFGGIGFAGLEKIFNYDSGIYRDAIKSRKEEISRSKEINKLYERLKALLPDKKVVVATHMPLRSWSKEQYNKNWYYLSGHTHKNWYLDDDTTHVFEDNQLGYDGTNFEFKFVILDKKVDIFENYKDGIFVINRENYCLFNFYQGIRIKFNYPFDKLYMLKRNKTYMFLMEYKGRLCLLAGGTKKRAIVKDVNYYYENMIKYQEQIVKGIKSYLDFEKEISNSIKAIGGSGRIHGAIVDIDYWNHVYVNPFDKTVTPYFANDIIDKYVYSNILSLLKFKVPDLYANYLKMIEEKGDENSLIIFKGNELSDNVYHEESTEMYKSSRLIKSMQFISSHRIIRNWNDEILRYDEGEKLTNAVKEIEMKEIKVE